MVSAMSRVTCVSMILMCNFPLQADASAFRGSGPAKPAMTPLLDELENIVGNTYRSNIESSASRIEDALRPTFIAMPKTADGGVKTDAVRYMMHRYFVDRHGWFVEGLGSAGDAANNSLPSGIFKDGDNDDVSEFFEVRFQEHSFNLHQVAVFAATLESFVHNETVDRLNAAYDLLYIPTKTQMTPRQVQDVIESYMVMYVLGSNYSEVTPSWLGNLRRRITDVYPTWAATKKWVEEVQREVENSHDLKAPLESFNFSVKVLEEVGDRYGRWQNSECVDLKTSLLKLETPGTGRVPLDTFYKSALEDGNWQFSESIRYLRELGAIDESDPGRPSIVIPNYINAPSQCVASSKYYSVCCIDECEDLVSHLETRIAAPEASPQRIVDLVSELSSPTVPAPRTLPASLIQRLEEIASHHHGTVPFHGRLFAQWMHHAYPRECSYPHMSGTLTPLPPLQWQKQTGLNAAADEAEMKVHIDAAKKARTADVQQPAFPWSGEEELFVARSARPHARTFGLWAFCKGLAGSGAIVSVAITIFRMQSSTSKSSGLPFVRKNEKYFV